ncbi:pyridoxamine 5'-phosphate oxidase family protein [Labrenzia sp. CE80]|uniref:FAD-binding oxidoreductase n=1 Tax=Labrenzia sp. CE80 TaxID=1788986 RepID=UPI00129A87F7|nr:pyridoxamine 5'-phosphate oxidase family protein [Labrenzia sp. CE80]
MTKLTERNPFHAGERAAQLRAGVEDVAQWAGGFVRDYLPEQHRDFHMSLPFLVVASGDTEGRTWVSVVEGEDGFVCSPDPRRLILKTGVDPNDPLAGRFEEGGDIGVVGIELASRRRNRFSGHLHPVKDGYGIDIRQTFGNCPQYIHERNWTRVRGVVQQEPVHSNQLSARQIARIRAADTLFIGSGYHSAQGGEQGGEQGDAANGYDASHRGGPAGFAQVVSPVQVQIPDYPGNNFFNTIGNLVSDPRVGLLFIDFETGGLLHLSGRASVDWSPDGSVNPDARRMITVEIEAVVDRPGALSLRWVRLDDLSRKLRLVRKTAESSGITSFYLGAADGRPLDPFLAGQHLPVTVQIPSQTGTSGRSYSLSGAASDSTHYRLGIKREEHGLVSRFLHDHLHEGDVIEARAPSGDFTLPAGEGPVVLVSAGVGLTPMLSMLHELAAECRTGWYVHATRNRREHAFQDEVDALVAGNENIRQKIFYSQPGAGDVAGRHYDVKGRVKAAQLIALNQGADADYLLCGPSRFIADLRGGLEGLGVPASKIHFETFGPTG